MVFTTTLDTAVATRWVRDRSVLSVRRRAARARPGRRWILAARGRRRHGLAGDLRPPAGDIAGTPVHCFRPTGRFRAAIDRADGWLSSQEILTVTDASVCLLAGVEVHRRPATGRYKRSLELLRQGQSDDGGWGPRASSPPEPFDTALALLALAKCDPSPERPRHDRTRAGFLIAQQQDDGSWIETTRPAGQRQLRPADLDHRLGDSRPPGDPRVVTRATAPIRNGNSTVLVVTRLEIGPAASTSNGCATLFPARSSSSVPRPGDSLLLATGSPA